MDAGEEIFCMGARFKEERERLGFSQKALAGLIGTTSRTVIKYEVNETSPRARELFLLHGQGADVFYIVTGTRQPLGVAQDRAPYTPAERAAAEIARLPLSETDAALLLAIVKRFVQGESKSDELTAGSVVDVAGARRAMSDRLIGKKATGSDD